MAARASTVVMGATLLAPFERPSVGRRFLAIVAVILLFAGGAQSLLTPYDDAFFAASAKQLAADGRWLDLSARGGPLYEKPPLAIWLEAISIRALGPTSFAARLPGLLVAWAGLAAAYALLSRRVGHPEALLGCLILMTTQQFIYFARRPVTEIYLAVWVMLALLAYAEALREERGRWFALAGLFTGLAVMTKGMAGLLPVLVIAAHWTASGRWQLLSRRAFWALPLVVIVIAAPWHLAALARHGEEFARVYFWQTQLSFLGGTTHVDPWHWTAIDRKIVENYWPWLLALIPALVAATAAAWRERRAGDGGWPLLLLAWCVGIIGFFHLTYVKRHQYILPAYPALAFLSAWGIMRWRHGRRVLAATTVWMALLIAVALAAPRLWTRIVDNNLYRHKEGVIRYLAAHPGLRGTLLVLDDDPNYCFTCDTATYYTRLSADDYSGGGLRAALVTGGRVLVMVDDVLSDRLAADLPPGRTLIPIFAAGGVSLVEVAFPIEERPGPR